jgi:hypothetical protein
VNGGSRVHRETAVPFRRAVRRRRRTMFGVWGYDPCEVFPAGNWQRVARCGGIAELAAAGAWMESAPYFITYAAGV